MRPFISVLFLFAAAFANDTRQTDVTISLRADIEQPGLPTYRRRHLIFRGSSRVEVYDLAGRSWRPNGSWSTSAAKPCVVPTDVDISADGTMVAVDGFCNDYGTGRRLAISGRDSLLFFDSNGSLAHLSFSPSAWRSFGAAFDKSGNVLLLGVVQGGRIWLRNYTANGDLVNEVPIYKHLTIPGTGISRGEQHLFIMDRQIGILIDHNDAGLEWLVVSTTGELVYGTVVKAPSFHRFTTTSDGRLFAQENLPSSVGRIVMFDPTASTWRSILTTDGKLVGSDENRLVLMMPDANRKLHLQWIEV